MTITLLDTVIVDLTKYCDVYKGGEPSHDLPRPTSPAGQQVIIDNISRPSIPLNSFF
jgi:hypothetical protein